MGIVDFKETKQFPCDQQGEDTYHLRLVKLAYPESTFLFSKEIVEPKYQSIHFFHETKSGIFGICPLCGYPLVILKPQQTFPLEIVYKGEVMPIILANFHVSDGVLCVFAKSMVIRILLQCSFTNHGFYELTEGNFGGKLKLQAAYESKGSLIPIREEEIRILDDALPERK